VSTRPPLSSLHEDAFCCACRCLGMSLVLQLLKSPIFPPGLLCLFPPFFFLPGRHFCCVVPSPSLYCCSPANEIVQSHPLLRVYFVYSYQHITSFFSHLLTVTHALCVTFKILMPFFFELADPSFLSTPLAAREALFTVSLFDALAFPLWFASSVIALSLPPRPSARMRCIFFVVFLFFEPSFRLSDSSLCVLFPEHWERSFRIIASLDNNWHIPSLIDL